MDIAACKHAHGLIIDGDLVGAANYILSLMGQDAKIQNKNQALQVCRGVFQYLLDNDMYLNAAALQWGEKFQTEPESVVRAFNAVQESNMLLMMGGSSLGKSFSVGAWLALDYLRDPLYTSVKLAAVSEKHLKENLYPHVIGLVRNCCIPSEYEFTFREADLWMGVKEAGLQFGISGLAFKQSQETSGQFKGYKFVPVRKRAHPKFGYMSRLRLLLDESQNAPGGPFQDMNSLIASVSGSETIKLICAFNPENTSCKVVQLAEPEHGWRIEDLETLYDYTAKSGWRVCRLDAARCENVIQRKIVYHGLQTYDGYLTYLKSGGDNSPAYCCFGRGFPPIKGTIDVVIPPAWFADGRGEATFVETPEDFAGVDLAFMGKDTAQMAIGRWGKASGYRDQFGKFIKFKNRLNIAEDKPRYVLQIDQILPLAKHDNVVPMAEEIIAKANALGIKPENVAVDATGMGFGVSGHLRKLFGEVISVSWNEKATEGKITADDLDGADKQCDGVMSEMWWAFRRWFDPSCRAILINPIIPSSPLQTQMTTRRYKANTTKGIKVEKKEDYMARNAQGSPDESDSIILLLHAVRLRSKVLPGLVEQQDTKQSVNDKAEIKFTPVKKMMGSDAEDSLCASGSDEY